jgi:hypothetical protein
MKRVQRVLEVSRALAAAEQKDVGAYGGGRLDEAGRVENDPGVVVHGGNEVLEGDVVAAGLPGLRAQRQAHERCQDGPGQESDHR